MLTCGGRPRAWAERRSMSPCDALSPRAGLRLVRAAAATDRVIRGSAHRVPNPRAAAPSREAATATLAAGWRDTASRPSVPLLPRPQEQAEVSDLFGDLACPSAVSSDSPISTPPPESVR